MLAQRQTYAEIKPGQRVELILTATYTDRTKGDITELANYSSSSDIILVDDKGVITVSPEAKYKDKAIITIKYNGKTTKCRIYVTK